MKRLLVIFFVTATLVSKGQVSQTISRADPANLNTFLKRFIKEIESKNAKAIKQMSLKMINCISCVDQSTPPADYLVPVDTFINRVFNNEYSRLLVASKEQTPMFNSIIIGETLRQTELKGQKNVRVYELFFVTMKPNELEKGREGQSMAFQFIKLRDGFRFYGVESVP